MEEPTSPIEHPLDKPSTEEERDELNQMLDEAGDSEILCGMCRSDRQASGKAEEAIHTFTLDD